MEAVLRDGRGLGVNWVSGGRCTGAVLACKRDNPMLGLMYLVDLVSW